MWRSTKCSVKEGQCVVLLVAYVVAWPLNSWTCIATMHHEIAWHPHAHSHALSRSHLRTGVRKQLRNHVALCACSLTPFVTVAVPSHHHPNTALCRIMSTHARISLQMRASAATNRRSSSVADLQTPAPNTHDSHGRLPSVLPGSLDFLKSIPCQWHART